MDELNIIASITVQINNIFHVRKKKVIAICNQINAFNYNKTLYVEI